MFVILNIWILDFGHCLEFRILDLGFLSILSHFNFFTK